ncbi:MAG: imidazoleglycerol-phosphate dehydratase HisB [Deltaproteobacteria bacterium]|nr:imidazoleglycerol-phosphate dehydratase HisB [Deltaproteobacteria bacterium]
MRSADVNRETSETSIRIELGLDGAGRSEVATGIGFFDHMLQAFAKHGLFDLKVEARGDLHVDQHHLLEDTGIVLGEAFSQALGGRAGIARAGFFVFPMDEAVAFVTVDVCGRSLLHFEADFTNRTVGDLEVALLREFFFGFSQGLKCVVHVTMPYGENDHHKAEAIFKAFGKAMKTAVTVDKRAAGEIPSTKGTL